MSHLAEVPVWIAVIVAAFVTIGSVLTLLGTIGLVRLTSFYDRLHAPTLGTSWGTAAILLASAILFTATGARIVLHEVVVGILIMLTTAATMVTLGGAALHRDRLEGRSPEKTPAERPAAGKEAEQS